MSYILVAIGGALGSIARYFFTDLMGNTESSFPWGTLIVNITGSFIMGFFAVAIIANNKFASDDNIRLFSMIGICGGYTTFSSFSLQTVELIYSGKLLYAGLNVVSSITFCLIAAMLGYSAATFCGKI